VRGAMRPSVGEARLLCVLRRGARPRDERDANRARSCVRTPIRSSVLKVKLAPIQDLRSRMRASVEIVSEFG
jgi:hypothetical protein